MPRVIDMIYVWATLLLVANLAALCGTLFLLPGNWIVVGLAALYAFLLPQGTSPHVSWTVVAVAAGLALLGELIEFLAGAAGAKKHGGSRRGMLLAVVGTFAGSLLGASIGVPIPVVGPIVGALGGGALGAFAGAYAGEFWIGRPHADRVRISHAAMIGRLLGTAGKLIVAVMIVTLVTLDSFIDLGSTAALPAGAARP